MAQERTGTRCRCSGARTPGAIEHNRELAARYRAGSAASWPDPSHGLEDRRRRGREPRPSASSSTPPGRWRPGTRGPGAAPAWSGPARAGEIAADALRAVRAAHGSAEVSSTLLCMAGSRPSGGSSATASRASAGSTVDDSVPVLELATRGGPGLVLHAGTGSFVAARTPDGAVHYAGGIGWRFGDEGSGYDLGRRAIARALLELQGWAPPPGLGALVRERTGTRRRRGRRGLLLRRPGDQHGVAGARARACCAWRARGTRPRGGRFGIRPGSSSAGRLGLQPAVPGRAPGVVPGGVSGHILNHPFAYRPCRRGRPFPWRGSPSPDRGRQAPPRAGSPGRAPLSRRASRDRPRRTRAPMAAETWACPPGR
jgi:glucosamine kinase